MKKTHRKAIFLGNTGFSLYHFRLPLMKELKRRRWEVVAIAKNEGGFARKFTELGFRFISVPMDHKGRNPLKDLMLTFALTKLYRKERPSLVHHFTIKPVIFGSLAAKCAKIPNIVNTITGLGYTFEKLGWMNRMVVLLYYLAIAGRPKVIFQNMDDLELFAKRGIVKKKRYLIRGSGVDTNRIRPIFNSIKSEKVIFLMVGRMLWSKGVLEFVKAAAIVKQKVPNVSFLMVGGHSGGGAEGNPDAVPVSWLEEENKKGTVQWLERVDFDKVMRLLDKTDVAVLPSYREGLPRSLLDAAAKGKPIITTDTPGCREVVRQGINGFLVGVRDAQHLAAHMMNFVLNPELIQKMGKESRRIAVREFDIKKVINETINIYES